MPRNNFSEVKIQKTLKLLGVANLLLSPLLLIDSRFGLAVALIANGLFISHLHDLGKKRRPGSNFIHQGMTYAKGTFFAQNSSNEVQSDEIDNALRNIINGGDAIYDDITNTLSNLGSNR